MQELYRETLKCKLGKKRQLLLFYIVVLGPKFYSVSEAAHPTGYTHLFGFNIDHYSLNIKQTNGVLIEGPSQSKL